MPGATLDRLKRALVAAVVFAAFALTALTARHDATSFGRLRRIAAVTHATSIRVAPVHHGASIEIHAAQPQRVAPAGVRKSAERHDLGVDDPFLVPAVAGALAPALVAPGSGYASPRAGFASAAAPNLHRARGPPTNVGVPLPT